MHFNINEEKVILTFAKKHADRFDASTAKLVELNDISAQSIHQNSSCQKNQI